MHDVFISCSRRDAETVDRLASYIEAGELSPWVDRKDIPAGEVWRDELRSAIIDSDILMFVISPDSIASRHCRMELEFAVEHNKRIIPVSLRELDAGEDLPATLSARQLLKLVWTDESLCFRASNSKAPGSGWRKVRAWTPGLRNCRSGSSRKAKSII